MVDSHLTVTGRLTACCHLTCACTGADLLKIERLANVTRSVSEKVFCHSAAGPCNAPCGFAVDFNLRLRYPASVGALICCVFSLLFAEARAKTKTKKKRKALQSPY